MNQKTSSRSTWELPESLWEIAEPLVTKQPGSVGAPTEVNLKLVLAGIFYVLRTGCHWQACPRDLFGPPSTVHYYHQKWCSSGVFERIWLKALERYDDLVGIDWRWQSAEGAMTKAPLGGEATGANPTDRGKSGTKRSLLTDGAGIPLSILPAGANRHDLPLLSPTLVALVPERPLVDERHPQPLCLDKAYDSQRCREDLQQQNDTPHIRSRGEEKQEKTDISPPAPPSWIKKLTEGLLTLLGLKKKPKTRKRDAGLSNGRGRPVPLLAKPLS